ncbi:hypothetical protein M7I_8020 [Glarea lozoyensis 74030]|uniref:Uncharacterized protein n=1 Tax=Glarea lozoyensis (strain ATCC 74030 / MF5533) TaxID=1104152 RepID=H0EYV9_GLAL7|nr:hypothetical protein M7I_8020 [Glarea lozoyensis 74030]
MSSDSKSAMSIFIPRMDSAVPLMELSRELAKATPK